MNRLVLGNKFPRLIKAKFEHSCNIQSINRLQPSLLSFFMILWSRYF